MKDIISTSDDEDDKERDVQDAVKNMKKSVTEAKINEDGRNPLYFSVETGTDDKLQQ